MNIKIDLVKPKPSYYQKRTTCRECDKSLDRQGQFCQSCYDERKQQRNWKNRKIKVCQFKGCNNKPNPSSLIVITTQRKIRRKDILTRQFLVKIVGVNQVKEKILNMLEIYYVIIVKLLVKKDDDKNNKNTIRNG